MINGARIGCISFKCLTYSAQFSPTDYMVVVCKQLGSQNRHQWALSMLTLSVPVSDMSAIDILFWLTFAQNVVTNVPKIFSWSE